jgi:hypothetical protein
MIIKRHDIDFSLVSPTATAAAVLVENHQCRSCCSYCNGWQKVSEWTQFLCWNIYCVCLLIHIVAHTYEHLAINILLHFILCFRKQYSLQHHISSLFSISTYTHESCFMSICSRTHTKNSFSFHSYENGKICLPKGKT